VIFSIIFAKPFLNFGFKEKKGLESDDWIEGKI